MNTTDMKESTLGHFVPVSQIRPIVLLRDEVVQELVEEAKVLQTQIATFKTKAMDAIADSIQITGTSSYLRLYERNSSGKYAQIPLDPSKL